MYINGLQPRYEVEPSLLKPIFNHFGIFFCPSFDTVEDEAEAEDVWRSEVDETLYCGGAGRSIALERIDDTSGAVTLDAK